MLTPGRERDVWSCVATGTSSRTDNCLNYSQDLQQRSEQLPRYFHSVCVLTAALGVLTTFFDLDNDETVIAS